jgi:TRAP-type C4-dicarboxylate transport system permease small subunit
MSTRLERLQSDLLKTGVALERAIFIVDSVLLVFLSVVLFLQVVYRYILELPLPWTEEAARHGLVWFAMLAAAAAARRGHHFAFRWATLMLPGGARAALRHVVDLIAIAFLSVIFAFSIRYLDIVSNQTSIATGINMQIPYLGVSVGIGLFILFYLLDLADAALSLVTCETLSVRVSNEKQIESMLLMSDVPAASDGEQLPLH